jgi:hypothetical protein
MPFYVTRTVLSPLAVRKKLHVVAEVSGDGTFNHGSKNPGLKLFPGFWPEGLEAMVC